MITLLNIISSICSYLFVLSFPVYIFFVDDGFKESPTSVPILLSDSQKTYLEITIAVSALLWVAAKLLKRKLKKNLDQNTPLQ